MNPHEHTNIDVIDTCYLLRIPREELCEEWCSTMMAIELEPPTFLLCPSLPSPLPTICTCPHAEPSQIMKFWESLSQD